MRRGEAVGDACTEHGDVVVRLSEAPEDDARFSAADGDVNLQLADGLALAAGEAPENAMRLANTASGLAVMENGTAVCSRVELEAGLATSPVPVRLGGGRS